MKETSVEIVFTYSKNKEMSRVLETIRLLSWFRANKYPENFAKLPKGISESSSIKEIEDAVSNEYVEQDFQDIEKHVLNQWKNFEEGFEEIKKIEAIQLQNSYEVTLTRYGSGGSYDVTTSTIIINSKSTQRERIIGAIIHEIIHMTIQRLIEAYSISHWRKEALVDLLLERFFPMLHMRQSIPEDVSIVENTFQTLFPDIEGITRVIGKDTPEIELLRQ